MVAISTCRLELVPHLKLQVAISQSNPDKAQRPVALEVKYPYLVEREESVELYLSAVEKACHRLEAM
jgi:hypothetical protein